MTRREGVLPHNEEVKRVAAAPEPDVALSSDEAVVPRRPRRGWRKHRLGILGLVLVGTVVLSSLIGPFFIDLDANQSDLANRLLPPGSEVNGRTALFGTDALGRDQLARVLIGGRASLSVVLLALVLGGGLGTMLGMISGFRGGWVDTTVMRLVDSFLALPTIVLAMLVAATLGGGFVNTAITLGIAGWAVYARLIRAEVLKIREEDYIGAAVALGGSDNRILMRHIGPNILSSLLVVASLELGRMVLTESSLSYLGFGMQPPDASWGSMIRQGQAYVQSAWWLSTVPGVFIAVMVLGLNLVGDWLRDILDPRNN
ncbi:MAG TPA: ABC transporter permease [Acidimicrobiia bacterium]|nr:ABC transporter permease [Acidimicrobiia bacterium]